MCYSQQMNKWMMPFFEKNEYDLNQVDITKGEERSREAASTMRKQTLPRESQRAVKRGR